MRITKTSRIVPSNLSRFSVEVSDLRLDLWFIGNDKQTIFFKNIVELNEKVEELKKKLI